MELADDHCGNQNLVLGARIGFFIGKGGVGTSTLAAATAVRAACAGTRVLMVCTDQAHCVSSIFNLSEPLSGRTPPVRVHIDQHGSDGGGSLDVLAIDTLVSLEIWGSELLDVLAARFPGLHINDVVPQELSSLPGIQQVLGLYKVARLAASERWDYVVADCAGVVDATQLLSLPLAFSRYLQQMWPRHQRLSVAGDDPKSAAAAALAERITTALEELSALLTNTERVGVHIVLSPERIVVADTLRRLGSLLLMGIRVREVIVNQVLSHKDIDQWYADNQLPQHPVMKWYHERVCEQHTVLEQLREALTGAEMICVDQWAHQPTGLTALYQLLETSDRREGNLLPAPPQPVVHHESGSGLHSIYCMRLELPQIDSDSLTLGRVGDDLIVGAAGIRQPVRLAPVLRRCIVLDAALQGSELRVRFQPDPQVWPQ